VRSIRRSLTALGWSALLCTNWVVAGTSEQAAAGVSDVTAQRATRGMASDAANALLSPPTLKIAFGKSVIAPNSDTTLTFTVLNPNPQDALDGISFLDNLPLGLVISLADGQAQDCGGGTISALPGTGTISLSGATLAGGASCQFAVVVTGIALGVQFNSTSTISSNETAAGAAASASITVQFADSYQVAYVANLANGESYIDMTNAGSNMTNPADDPGGSICVNVYGFTPGESMFSCCSCLVSPNGLKSLSIQRDLVENPLFPGVPTSITVKLVATQPLNGSCDPSYPTNATLTQGLRAWSTTLHPTPFGFARAEHAFETSYLNPDLLTEFTMLCGFIEGNGSGFGICRSCQLGGLGGQRR